MTTNRIQRTIRLSVLSALLVLAALSFLAFGSASAYAAPAASTSTATTVRIVTNQQGGRVFSPAAITVKSGTTVRIVNRTTFSLIIFTNGGIVRLSPKAAMTLAPTSSQFVGICGGGSLSITVA